MYVCSVKGQKRSRWQFEGRVACEGAEWRWHFLCNWRRTDHPHIHTACASLTLLCLTCFCCASSIVSCLHAHDNNHPTNNLNKYRCGETLQQAGCPACSHSTRWPTPSVLS